MCLISTLTFILTACLIFFVVYGEFYASMRDEVRKEAIYVTEAVNRSGEDYLSAIKEENLSRITLIASDGTVLFESDGDPSQMDNHIDRPEISSALKTGVGEASRLSNTIGKQTFYYAVRLNDGNIVRIANTAVSALSVVLRCIPYFLIIIVIMLILILYISRWRTKSIVAPINAIDLKDPLSNDAYEELSPLLLRLSKQNIQIETQMEELRGQKTELSSISESMNEGLIILGKGGIVLLANNSALNIFNASADLVLGKHIFILNRSMPIRTVTERVLNGDSAQAQLTLNDHYYQLMATPIEKNSGITGAVILILDVTERSEAEQMRREFTANVSHELKTPLTTILGYAEIMKDGIAKPQDYTRFAKHIYAEATRLIALVKDIINLSKLDEGNLDTIRETVDLFDISNEVLNDLAEFADKKGINLSLSGKHAFITGDRQILYEIIFNLCDNAIKYNIPNGTVKINVLKENDGVTLSVEDSGIGIPIKHQSRVFERFYRVDKSHSKETGGTGLGLSIVKHGVLYHNAKISLQSEPGKGTIFKILFP